MTIQLFNTSDDLRTINKTLTNSIEITGVRFKDDTNILQPVLDLSYDERIFSKNYLHIGKLNRYYFIKNIITTNNRLYVECEIDVLYTYSTGIKATTAFIERQGATTKADSLLPDPLVPIKANNRIYLDGDGDVDSTVAAKWGRVTDDRDGDFVMLIGGGQVNIGG